MPKGAAAASYCQGRKVGGRKPGAHRELQGGADLAAGAAAAAGASLARSETRLLSAGEPQSQGDGRQPPAGLTCTSDSRTSGASERRGWKELSRVLSCSAVRAGRLRVGRGPRAALLKPAGGRKGTESLWLQVLPTGDRLSSLGRRRSSGLTQTPHPLPLCTGPFGKAVSFDYRDRPPPSVGLGRGAGGSEGWWSPFSAKAGGARQTASGTTSWVSVEPV